MEAPEFDDALDEDDEQAVRGGNDFGRAPAGSQGGDEAATGERADVTEEPDAGAADVLFSVAVPDR